jgi:Tannase and feruloyl esterase
MAFNHPQWDWKTFDLADPKNFALLVEASKRLGPILNSIDPDLTAFQRLGGKLILYHGWLDQNISPRNSIRYYESVADVMGEETRDFARLFMAPGMGRCGGGPGPDTLDALAALEAWVEKKQAPQQIVASHATNGRWIARARCARIRRWPRTKAAAALTRPRTLFAGCPEGERTQTFQDQSLIHAGYASLPACAF